MTPEHWQHIKSLLQSALEREPGERSAFLAAACADDEPLRKDVESLILSHEQAGGFIESPAFEVMAESLGDQTDSLAGRSFGPYQIIARIGIGGMGEVYLAEDSRLGRKVALKMLPTFFTEDNDRVRRFQQEARAASALNHPNILTIYEIGQIAARHFIATEFIEGETLRRRMTRTGMRINEALEVSIQVASALSAAHQAAIAHRDIKPGNIMLRPDTLVKVLDFGLAKLTEPKFGESEAATLVNTKQGIVMGTAHYMSPEQTRGQRVDARTDIWSLGVVLYEMTTGRMPFEGQTASDVISLILQKEPLSPARHALEVPPELERIITKALRKDREERYQTVKDMLLDLKSLKQRLEFEAELERSLPPGAEGRASAKSNRAAKVETVKKRKGVLSGSSRAVSGQRRARKAIESLAVLPLINSSADPNLDYLSDGITESIINNLSQVPRLRVFARSTMFRYKGREVEPQEVGRELGARAVLTGRVLQLEERLVIGTELVDVGDGSQLWGEQYHRGMADIFALQEEISQQISEKLRLKLSGAEKKRLTKRHTKNTQAYELYLKGRFFWNKRTEEDANRGIEYFQQALSLDPNFALAYAGMADCQTLLGDVGVQATPPKEAFLQGQQSAARALELDNALAEAHGTMGHIYMHLFDWPGAERELRRSLELNPNHAHACNLYAYYLAFTGQFKDSIASINRALQIDPLSLPANRSAAELLYFAGRLDESIDRFHKSIEMDPHYLAHLELGRVYEHREMYEAAFAEFAKARELSHDSPESLASLAHCYAVSGETTEARTLLQKLAELSERQYVSPFDLALIHGALGQTDEAFEWLERAYGIHDGWMIYITVDPRFKSLRSDPRFADLVRRIGLGTEEHHTAKELPGGPTSASIPMEQEIRFCTTTDGVRIAYATVGQGPPLLKAANWLNHLEFDWRSPIWRHLLEEFARDHLLVRYDERGNGLSDWDVENFTFEAFVRDLESVVEAVGLDRFPILGISQGGPVAIAYAVRHPERVSHLILYGSYARGWAKRGAPDVIERFQALKTLIKLGWGQDNPAFRQLWSTLYAPDATPEQWQWFNDLHRVSTSPDNAIRLEDELGKIDVVDLLSQAKVPTLVLHCRDEVVVPFEEGRLLASLIPGARFVPLEGRNHLLLESEPAWAKFITEVRRFLKTGDT